MEINNINKGTHEDELCSLSEIFSSFCAEDHNELNPLQEIFGAPSSSRPKDVTKNIDQKLENEEDKKIESDRTAKRQRSMEYRVMMEKEMIPNCPKSDLATRLGSIIEYIKSLKHGIDVMSMAYAATPMYTPPFYGAQAPCMPTWGYYTPGLPMMPHQNMPVIPPFHQVQDKAAPEQTKP